MTITQIAGRNGLEKAIRIGTNIVKVGEPRSLVDEVKGVKLVPVKSSGYFDSTMAQLIGINGDVNPQDYQRLGIIPRKGASKIIVVVYGDPNDGGDYRVTYLN